MKNFKGLKIWQKGFDIAVHTYQLTETFPKEEKFGISMQINRSAVSISSNIAEGSSRTSEKDYKRYLEIGLGSCFELETQLLIANAAKMGQNGLLDPILKEIDEEQKMLMAFIRSLEK